MLALLYTFILTLSTLGGVGWKCTVHPEFRCTSDWFMIACLRVFIGNTNHNPLEQGDAGPTGERSCWSIA